MGNPFYLFCSVVVLLCIFGIAHWIIGMLVVAFKLPGQIQLIFDVFFGLVVIFVLMSFMGWIPGWQPFQKGHFSSN